MIELHCHSTASDGYFSPVELIEYAAARGISTLCLTDHDTVAGFEPAYRAGRSLGVRVIPGIEIEISHPSGSFHLLGLGIHDYKGTMDDVLPRILEDRERRNRKIAKKMNQLGVPGEYRDVQQLAGGEIVGRPHFAEYLIRKGFALDIPDAFERFLGPGQALYVPREGLELKEAIDKIHRAGGKAVIAHPGTLHMSWTKLKKALEQWVPLGLDGLEAFHSSVKLREARKFQKAADEFGILSTPGSDFHTPEHSHRKIGHYCVEQVPMDESILEDIFG
ncbi:PHP domain-containing protein [Salinispira pacifica]|uniref:Putative metal-dependent phosphoesterases (PHP family) n=1 Tax=Salinispira pacifica TaxID=1307761 RepID=V5WGQ6_9SPIO|nr:PHP domain-containing protein [Salinispira pacifica]AHC14810.1 putative metal-dependent phosphoesterases (PHP family) [Salinispira pacifica]